jgi:hypothetical protein
MSLHSEGRGKEYSERSATNEDIIIQRFRPTIELTQSVPTFRIDRPHRSVVRDKMTGHFVETHPQSTPIFFDPLEGVPRGSTARSTGLRFTGTALKDVFRYRGGRG